MSYLNAQYNALETEVVQIASGGDYSAYSLFGSAPADTAFALALFYSEDQTLVDNCVLTAGGTPPEPEPPVEPGDNLLVNGDFESELANWLHCGRTDLAGVIDDADTGSAALQVSGGGCMYQEFEITEGREYRMNCRAKQSLTDQYSSVSLTLMDAGYMALENSESAVSGTSFADYSAVLAAPTDSRFGSVVVYSEDPAVFDNCSVTIN